MKSNIIASDTEINSLFHPDTIRDRARKVFQLTEEGKTSFSYHPEKLDATVALVEEVTRANYPDLNIPFHSRWGHFKVGGVDRLKLLSREMGSDSVENCKALIDLVMVSVLLDAGAGDNWRYYDRSTDMTFARSEGLAVASFNMFKEGFFSSDENNPFRCDNEKLLAFSEEDLRAGFQVTDENPLEGLSGRVHVINQLGKSMPKRPGDLFDLVDKKLSAAELLGLVLKEFGNIWPSRLTIGETSLGDVWFYPKLGEATSVESLVPFHKLSQWLTYSLMEPLTVAGIEITDLNSMTGLPEYRNGGLLLDSGLISLKDSSLADMEHAPGSELIVEWRALTIYFLDLIAAKLREKLQLNDENFPLVKVLEGGTWWAGRKLAANREGGGPPLKLKSDGTVF